MSYKNHRLIAHFFSALAIIVVITYPLLIHQGVDNIQPRYFAMLLLTIFLLRTVILKELKNKNQWFILAGVFLFCLTIAIFDSEELLKYYPVLMNAGFSALFLFSLKGEASLIEQFMRAGGKTPPTEALGYIRYLSLLWGIFLLANAIISAYTACCTSLSFWALYNGVIAYIAIATFVILELLYRAYYKKKHFIHDK